MSSFEYVSVFAAIIVGLGVADLLVSLHRLLRRRREVRWDWAAPLVALLVLLTIVQIWWAMFRPQTVSLTIGAFLPQLVELVLLFLLASAVLPDEVPADGMDLKVAYEESRGYVWTLFACALGWLMATGWAAAITRGVPLLDLLMARWMDLAVLAVMVSLALVRRRWWHAVAVTLLLVGGPLGWLSRQLG